MLRTIDSAAAASGMKHVLQVSSAWYAYCKHFLCTVLGVGVWGSGGMG